jgi:predicted methyltransferase
LASVSLAIASPADASLNSVSETSSSLPARRESRTAPEIISTAIADVGSGTGLYLSAFSAAVGPAGRVYAVDISPRFTEFIERRIRTEKLGNVATVRSTITSTMLQPGSVSHAFVCDAYHHFDRYPEMLASIHAALQPVGELVVVDFDRIPGVSREWLLTHVRADKKTVRREIEVAGFRFVEEVPIAAFKENYLLRFRKPATE